MKNKLLVLISLTMIVFSTSAFAKKVEKMPVFRNGYYYEHFSTNIANGQYEIYHENGQIYKTMTYKNGKQDGLFEWYYENGQLEYKRTYKNGKMEGLYVRYNRDGTLSRKCFYVNGKQYECEYASESKGILE